MAKRLTADELQELGRYFNPNAQIVSSLPNVKSVRDFSEVAMPNKDGSSFNTYKMIKGQWIQTGSNVTNVTQIAQGGSGGTGTVATAASIGLGNVTNDAQLKASQLSTDEGLGANLTSDSLVPSQKAAKIYVDYHRLNLDGHNSAEVYASALRLDEGSSSAVNSGLIFDCGDSLIGY